MDTAFLRLDSESISPRRLAGCFAEIFSSLDENPRELKVEVELGVGGYSVDMEEGEPVFRCEGRKSAHGRFRGRYLAEHEIPLRLPEKRRIIMDFIPTSGNRVKVRAR